MLTGFFKGSSINSVENFYSYTLQKRFLNDVVSCDSSFLDYFCEKFMALLAIHDYRKSKEPIHTIFPQFDERFQRGL